jgi:hypothetical protein
MVYMDDFETYPIPSQTQAVFYYKTQQDFDQNTFYRVELIRRRLRPGAVPKGWPVPWTIVQQRELPANDQLLALIWNARGAHLTIFERLMNQEETYAIRAYTYPVLTGSRDSEGGPVTDDVFWPDGEPLA